jgi:Ca-dependent carbohydrate-binding module xylan-binding
MQNSYSRLFLRAVGASALFLVSSFASAQSCPTSHPYACGGACYTDAAQAASGGCTTGGSGTSTAPASSRAASSTAATNSSAPATCASTTNPTHVISGRRTADTQPWCDTVCVTYIGNGTACLNAAGTLVSNGNVCSDPANARESMIDIEYNLGINIDDQFQAQAGYQGNVPSINPRLSYADARKYFVALLGEPRGTTFTNQLNLNGDAWLDRSEASAAKGADPRQLLGTGFGCGLSTDDIMAYVGLYMGDGAIDKYGGDLDPIVKANMLSFTRSWQPGVHAQACQYRGGCGASSSAASSRPASSVSGSKTIVVRARGTSGQESITLKVNNVAVATWTLTTSMQNYTVTTTGSGGSLVSFTNDSTGRDVQVDYLSVNGSVRQAEAQSSNTAVYQNGACGGGNGLSEWMHCNGAIGFGNL